jgi:septal ring factor EnvC (AmiA/AmiB activator)
MVRNALTPGLAVLLAFGVAFSSSAALGQKKLKTAIRMIIAKNDKRARSQRRVEKLGDTTDKLFNQYRETERQIEAIQIYNAQVAKLAIAQRKEIENLETSISEAARIGREVTPLMLRMIKNLEAFIQLDMPFSLKERTKRVKTLRAMMDKTDIPDSEKFRRILEAYQVENEFSRNIETYKAKLTRSGSKPRTVEFLRVGRIALVYQTLDGKESGYWNKRSKKWEEMPKHLVPSIRKGIRMARKQAAPGLIRLPVPPPKDVR